MWCAGRGVVLGWSSAWDGPVPVGWRSGWLSRRLQVRWGVRTPAVVWWQRHPAVLSRPGARGSQWLALLMARQAVSLAGVCGHQLWCGAEGSGAAWPPRRAAWEAAAGGSDAGSGPAGPLGLGTPDVVWWPLPPLASSAAPRSCSCVQGPAVLTALQALPGRWGPVHQMWCVVLVAPWPGRARRQQPLRLPCCRRQRVVGRCGRDRVPPCSSAASSSTDGWASRP
jgi:hypothetical protein